MATELAIPQAPAVSDMSRVDQAAILLMSLGEAEAAEILKHLGAKEVQRLGAAMAKLENVSREQASSVVTNFVTALEEQTSLGVGADDYVRRVLIGALGEERAGGVIDRILVGQSSKGLEALKWMDTKAVAEIVRNEHPQIIAIVLSYLDSDQAAELLALLPERVRPDVLMRIATLDGIQPNALRELDEIMEKQFANNNNSRSSSLGGRKSAANILNLMDSSSEQILLEKIGEFDQNLSEEIAELMFTFDNLLEIDDMGVQRLLRDVNSETLVLALKGADSALRDKVLNNMSSRAAEMLRDDMENRGPARVSDVEAAQKEILEVTRRLADEGEIMLGGGGGDEFI
ncbi:flagellar motor switch protein FliG [uncultured Abyssibacter sp.]|uniref:flagellar motor switch protein FliG n=1 Tax=uncultured Abyssibacter sp. TaxID=2320202 RepID=UPI0032B26F91